MAAASNDPHTIGGLTRRAAIGAMVAAGVGFAAFGPRGRREATGGRVVLDYWEKWTGHEGAAMQKVVDAFNASQSRLFVRYLVTGTIHQKALIAISGGNPPDIIGMYAFNVPSYADANAVLPLDELAPKFGLTLDAYASGMKQVMTHRGRWWGTINTGGTMALYYNKSLFREVGLDPDIPPRTIAEFDAAHNRLIKKKTDGTLERVGFLHKEPGWWSWIWGYHFGSALYDPATDRALADAPQTIAAYQWMQSYTKSLGVENVERFQSGFGPYGTPESAFLTGKVGMVNQGPWLANEINARKPDLDYGVCPLPADAAVYKPDAPIALIDTDVLMIPRGVRDPEASMEFIAFTQRPESVELLATAHCKGSPMAKVSEEFLSKHPNRGVRLHTALASSAGAFIAPTTAVWPEFKDVFDSSMDAMWKQIEPADQRLHWVQNTAQSMIDRYSAIQIRRGDRVVKPTGRGGA